MNTRQEILGAPTQDMLQQRRCVRKHTRTGCATSEHATKAGSGNRRKQEAAHWVPSGVMPENLRVATKRSASAAVRMLSACIAGDTSFRRDVRHGSLCEEFEGGHEMVRVRSRPDVVGCNFTPGFGSCKTGPVGPNCMGPIHNPKKISRVLLQEPADALRKSLEEAEARPAPQAHAGNRGSAKRSHAGGMRTTAGEFMGRMEMPSSSKSVATCGALSPAVEAQSSNMLHAGPAPHRATPSHGVGHGLVCKTRYRSHKICGPPKPEQHTSDTRSRMSFRSSMRSPLSAYFMDVLSSVCRCKHMGQ